MPRGFAIREEDWGLTGIGEAAVELPGVRLDAPGSYSVILTTAEGRLLLMRPLVLLPPRGG